MYHTLSSVFCSIFHWQTRDVIEKLTFVELGITKNEIDDLYERLGNDEEVMTTLENRAAEKNLSFPLKQKVATVQYELTSATEAYIDWQPSKVHIYSTSCFF